MGPLLPGSFHVSYSHSVREESETWFEKSMELITPSRDLYFKGFALYTVAQKLALNDISRHDV